MLSNEQIDAMVDHGIRSLSMGQALFVLIDPTLEDPVEAFTEMHGSVDMVRHVLPISALPKEKRPYLLYLGRYEVAERQATYLIRRAIEEASGRHDYDNTCLRSVCAFIDAPGSDVVSLVRCLGHGATMPARSGQRVVFRYWDPRVASQLPRLLGGPYWGQQLTCFGIATWWCYDSVNSPVGLVAISATGEEPRAEVASDGRIHLTEVQREAMEILSWANRVASLAPGWGLNKEPTLRELEPIIGRAMRHGLSKETDMLRFALAALSIHPDFDQHPEVVRMMSDDREFAQVMQGWSPEFIDELKHGVWRATEANSGR